MILSVVLFDAAGTTPAKHLAEASGVQWVDDIDAEGSFSFSVPVESAGALAVGSLVKFALGDRSDDYVFAGVVETLRVNKAGEAAAGAGQSYEVGGRGARALLEDAVVYPVGTTNSREFTAVSAGSIFRTLFLEAQARGALTAMSLGFTASTDSNGQAFTELLTVRENVGATLFEVAAGHQDIAVDVWVDADLTVHYANARGTDTTLLPNPVTLRVGGSISDLVAEQSGPIKNTLLVASGDYEPTYATETDAGSVGTYGRREGYLALSSTSDAAFAAGAAQKLLETMATPAEGITVQLDENGPVPYIDFGVGDRVYVADLTGARTGYMVRAVSVSQDGNGQLQFVPELGSARASLDRRLDRALRRKERGDLGGEFVIATPPGDTDGSYLNPEVGGIIPEYQLGEVISVDPVTGLGSVDIDGNTVEFYNGAFVNFQPGDVALFTTSQSIAESPLIGGATHVAQGLIGRDGAPGYTGSSTSFAVVPVGAVPGLPYQAASNFTLGFAGEGFITDGTSGSTVIDFVAPAVFSLGFPSTTTGCVGLSRNPLGTWAVVDNSQGTSGSHLRVKHNGTFSVHPYAFVRIVGVSRDKIIAVAQYRSGVAGFYMIEINSSGTVSYYNPTIYKASDGTLYTGARWSYGASGAFAVAGPYGVAMGPGGSTPTTVVVPYGSTTGVQHDLFLTSSTITTPGANRLSMDYENAYHLLPSTPRRTWQKMDLASGTVTTYSNNVPAGGDGEVIAALGNNDDSVVIGGIYDDGFSIKPAYYITSGTAVNSVVLEEGNSDLIVTRDGTGNALGRHVYTDALSGVSYYYILGIGAV